MPKTTKRKTTKKKTAKTGKGLNKNRPLGAGWKSKAIKTAIGTITAGLSYLAIRNAFKKTLDHPVDAWNALRRAS